MMSNYIHVYLSHEVSERTEIISVRAESCIKSLKEMESPRTTCNAPGIYRYNVEELPFRYSSSSSVHFGISHNSKYPGDTQHHGAVSLSGFRQ